MRVMAVHRYVQIRLRGHGKDWSRKQAATEVHQMARRAGRVKKEDASLVATGTLIKFKSGGDRSKQSWLLTQRRQVAADAGVAGVPTRGKDTAASFALWVTSVILKSIAAAEAAAATSATPKRNQAVLTEQLAKRYLRLLGWVYAKDANGAFTDSKCRDDVLAELPPWMGWRPASPRCLMTLGARHARIVMHCEGLGGLPDFASQKCLFAEAQLIPTSIRLWTTAIPPTRTTQPIRRIWI